MKVCRLHPFPGRHVALEFVAPDPIPEESVLARLALGALRELDVVLSPLAADLALVSSDPVERWPLGHARPSRPFWHIRRSDLPDEIAVGPTYTPSDVQEAPRLDSPALEQWIDRALARPSSEGFTAWSELRITAAAARLSGDSGGVLVVDTGTSKFTAPVEISSDGTRWALGPVEEARTEPPIDIVFLSGGGLLSLKLHVHWSLWADPTTPERRCLDAALAGLRVAGWEQVSTDLIVCG